MAVATPNVNRLNSVKREPHENQSGFSTNILNFVPHLLGFDLQKIGRVEECDSLKCRHLSLSHSTAESKPI